MQNEDVVRGFFLAYKQHAYPRMHALLSPDVHFKDFAFDIKGQRVFAMWQWFCTRPEPVEVPWFGNIQASGNTVTADYRVAYPYGEDKQPVDYVIKSRFVLKGGLIVEHHDEGDIHVWSRQALGWLASLISWAPMFKHFIRWQARKKLDAYMSTQTVAPSEGIKQR
jgi:hypothetical protein